MHYGVRNMFYGEFPLMLQWCTGSKCKFTGQ